MVVLKRRPSSARTARGAGMTTRASPPPPPPTHAASPQPVEFSAALQHLVASFWEASERDGRVCDEQSTIVVLEVLFGTLAYELGRIDGVARLHGVGRDQMLGLLTRAYADGKAATLHQHHLASKDCSCEASVQLAQELEFN